MKARGKREAQRNASPASLGTFSASLLNSQSQFRNPPSQPDQQTIADLWSYSFKLSSPVNFQPVRV